VVPPQDSDGPSEHFAGFSEVALIGRGGFSMVYRAKEMSTGRMVALKQLSLDAASRTSRLAFQRELIALAALGTHPNIVTLYRVIASDDGDPILVLELCLRSFADTLPQQVLLPRSAVSSAIKVAGALETAHRRGILHRDVKPQNILVTQYDEPALADFGIARLQRTGADTISTTFVFTISHASPEQLKGGELTPATDVYGLASTLYTLIAGNPPFLGHDGESPTAVVFRIASDPVPPLSMPSLPKGLEALVVAGMAKSPGERPQSAIEFAEHLRAIEDAAGWPPTTYAVLPAAVASANLSSPRVSAAQTVVGSAVPALPPEETPLPPLVAIPNRRAATRYALVAGGLVIAVLGLVLYLLTAHGSPRSGGGTSTVVSSSTTVSSPRLELSFRAFPNADIDDPAGIARGSDGALWFTNYGNDLIGRVNEDGTIQFYGGATSGIDNPEGIAAGPDGALWFTNSNGNSIGRITTSGQITEYPDPRAGSQPDNPSGITAGPDGALWFTNFGSDSIGRITISGVATVFGGAGINGPTAITVGSDGALWFTNESGNTIGRITTSGIVAIFHGNGINDPSAIVSGPDRALWFTNEHGSSIGRITTSGAVTIFSNTNSSTDIKAPSAIVSAFGALWFTNEGGESIGRITTAGAVTRYRTAASNIASPSAIVRGPGGTLWIVNSGFASRPASIGRIMIRSVAS
jgi:streptogramin lyase